MSGCAAAFPYLPPLFLFVLKRTHFYPVRLTGIALKHVSGFTKHVSSQSSNLKDRIGNNTSYSYGIVVSAVSRCSGLAKSSTGKVSDLQDRNVLNVDCSHLHDLSSLVINEVVNCSEVAVFSDDGNRRSNEKDVMALQQEHDDADNASIPVVMTDKSESNETLQFKLFLTYLVNLLNIHKLSLFSPHWIQVSPLCGLLFRL